MACYCRNWNTILWGKVAAAVVPSVIFGLLHIINVDVNLRDIILLLIAGTSVGIMFSLIVYQSVQFGLVHWHMECGILL